MRRFFFLFIFLTLFSLPALAYADAGHAAGTPHGEVSGTVHMHEDGTIEAHNDGAFVLATPWSPRWWMLMGISLILMGGLSIQVQRYLQVQ